MEDPASECIGGRDHILLGALTYVVQLTGMATKHVSKIIIILIIMKNVM
jgi:hypothetical protein